MPSKSSTVIRLDSHRRTQGFTEYQASFSLKPGNEIEIRELSKQYTYANPKQGMCMMACCTNKATHWLTRNNANYCQSDMICHQHAIIWKQVRDLISSSSSSDELASRRLKAIA